MTEADKRPLTPEETAELRRIIEMEKRTRWFWATVRTWAAWISAAVVGMYAVGDILMKAARKVIGGP